MGVPALDGFKLLLLMGAGALFALAGLYLLLRQQAGDGEAARIEIFGLKFQSSSAGLLVFLIGAGFIGAPLYVTEIRSPAPARAPPGTAQTVGQVGAETAGDAAGDAAKLGDIRLPRRADDEEIEPNDSISEANQIAMGRAVRGAARDGEVDWFVFAPDPAQADDFRITFRTLAGNCPNYHLLDGKENQLSRTQVCDFQVSRSLTYPIESDRYFVLVRGSGRTEYEVAVEHE